MPSSSPSPSGTAPDAIGGATGSNIRGYISFGRRLHPASTLAQEESTILNPPGRVSSTRCQFNAGVYCAPTRRSLGHERLHRNVDANESAEPTQSKE